MYMDERNSGAESAVSEVIGAMLMISVTLIVVALVAVYATGSAGETEQSIRADLVASGAMKNGSTYQVVFEHRSGDDFEIERLEVSIGSREQPDLHMVLRNDPDETYIEGFVQDSRTVRLGDRFLVSIGEIDSDQVDLPGGAEIGYGEHLTYRFIDRRTGSPISSGEVAIVRV